MHASKDNDAGDGEFESIITGKGMVLFGWWHQIDASYIQHASSTGIWYVFLLERQCWVFSPASNLGSSNRLQCFHVQNCLGFQLQMARRQSGSLLRKELDSLSFLQEHPEVQKHFSDAGCMGYVERLQNGYHQTTVEVFAKSYDGNKACVGL